MKNTYFFLTIVICIALVACSPSAGPAQNATDPESTDSPDQEPLQPTPSPVVPTQMSPVPSSTPSLDKMTVDVLTSRSPDEQWKAEALLAYPYNPRGSFVGNQDYARLIVYRLDGSQQWTPYEEWSETGLGDSYISDFYWTPDGRDLYFTHTGAADGCGIPFVTNLHRVNLQDGSIREILLTGIGLDTITVSPQVDRLAYRTEEGFVVHNIDTDEKQTPLYVWPPGFDYMVGWYAWSPDGKQLAFTINRNNCGLPGEVWTSIRTIDLESGEERIVRDHDTDSMVVTGWPEPGTLQVNQDGERYLFALDSGQLTPLPRDSVADATAALDEFLNSLYRAASDPSPGWLYERAAELYGGSYETLMEMNPHIEPSDRPALLRNACEVNGFQCLQIREILSVEVTGSEFRFKVSLLNPDGSVFSRAPGAATEEPQTEFVFTVQLLEDEVFKVLELPPYVPSVRGAIS